MPGGSSTQNDSPNELTTQLTSPTACSRTPGQLTHTLIESWPASRSSPTASSTARMFSARSSCAPPSPRSTIDVHPTARPHPPDRRCPSQEHHGRRPITAVATAAVAAASGHGRAPRRGARHVALMIFIGVYNRVEQARQHSADRSRARRPSATRRAAAPGPLGLGHRCARRFANHRARRTARRARRGLTPTTPSSPVSHTHPVPDQQQHQESRDDNSRRL